MKKTASDENLELRKIIFGQIHKKGPIPFSEFMDFCLYHPIHGYYATAGEKIGRRGDYFTSPSVHPVFGRLLARQIEEMGGFVGKDIFWIVEAGAGTGALASDILACLAEEFPRFFEKVRYGIVEKSSPFIQEQKIRLARYREKVVWLDLREEAGAALQGCFLANEFFDAFPIHRILVRDGKLLEIFVAEKGGNFHEVCGDLSTDDIHRYLDEMKVQLREGQQVEVNLEAMKWLGLVASVLSRGFLLTIDYGYLAEDLYHPDRRAGTLLCYYRHTWSDDPYVHIGRQDMTAHVDFTGLIKRGRSAGFHVTGFVPQYRFLLSLGLLDEMDRKTGTDPLSEASLQERLTMKHLILPDGGMGDTFKVLIQHRGVEEVQLAGLRDL